MSARVSALARAGSIACHATAESSYILVIQAPLSHGLSSPYHSSRYFGDSGIYAAIVATLPPGTAGNEQINTLGNRQ